jgi:hypothetical protein
MGTVLAAVLAVGLVALPAAASTDSKTFTATATDVFAGEDGFVTVTITNTTDPQTLGSANITLPAELNVGGVYPSLYELRDLNLEPGASTSIAIPVRAQCTSATATWNIQVKQSNEFNGTGNDFVQDGATTTDIEGNCTLEFTTQPANSERDQVITGDPYYYEDPDVLAEPYLSDETPLDPVTVTVVDGGGSAAVTWWADDISLALGFDASGGKATLGGTTTATPSNGFATFAPTLDVSAAGYVLRANTTGLAATTSAAFDIVDDADYCPPEETCTATTRRGNTSATITADEGGEGIDTIPIPLTVSVDPADLFVFLDATACSGYEGTSGTVQFFVDDANRKKTVSITVDGSAVDKPLKKFEVCFAAPYPFPTEDGTPSPELSGVFVGGEQVYAGLLPDCELPAPGPPGTNPPPCVSERTRDNKTKDVTVTFIAPASDQDPWGRI